MATCTHPQKARQSSPAAKNLPGHTSFHHTLQRPRNLKDSPLLFCSWHRFFWRLWKKYLLKYSLYAAVRRKKPAKWGKQKNNLRDPSMARCPILGKPKAWPMARQLGWQGLAAVQTKIKISAPSSAQISKRDLMCPGNRKRLPEMPSPRNSSCLGRAANS